MSIQPSDRWLWLGLTTALALAVLGVRATVRRDQQEQAEAAKANEEECDAIVEQDVHVNESIPLSTLRTLLHSSNDNFVDQASRLVYNRLDDGVLDFQVEQLLIKDLHKGDNRLAALAARVLENIAGRSHPPRLDYGIPLDNLPVDSPAETIDGYSDSFPSTLPSLDHEVSLSDLLAVPRERRDAVDVETRRRRREAVVLHEGFGELNEDDIIRPADLRSP